VPALDHYYFMVGQSKVVWQGLHWQGQYPSRCTGFFDRYPDGRFENLKVVVAGEIGTFEWDFVATDSGGQTVRIAGSDLLQFVGDKVAVKKIE
jgi:hypothetical protein